MTPKLIRVPALTDYEQRNLDELVAQWRAKRTRNNLRSAMYDMKNSERKLMGKNVPGVVKQRRFVLGWSAISVDKLSRRCNLTGFYDVGGVDLNALGLDDLIRENRLRNEVSQGGVSSLIHAVSWLVTTQGDVQADEPEVLINARSAETATGTWDVRRRVMKSFLSITSLDDKGEPTAMTMYLPDLNVFMSKNPSGGWTATRRAHSYGVPVDPLRHKPRLGREFGSSRITRAVMSIHMQALAAMIRADVNGEAYSLPRYVLLGAAESAFKNADGSPKSTWEAAWDAVWAIGDDEEAENPRADVKQFHGQSPEPQNAQIRMLAQLFSGETGIPVGELGITGDGNPTSAEALQASRDDLVATAEQTTDDWSPDLSASVTRALRMMNRGDVPEKLDVQPIWRNPMHVSRAAEADAGTKVVEKLPWIADTEVGMELMGLSPDQIKRAQAERRRARGTEILKTIRDRAGQGADTDPAA